jgi:hypothetical protein
LGGGRVVSGNRRRLLREVLRLVTHRSGEEGMQHAFLPLMNLSLEKASTVQSGEEMGWGRELLNTTRH